MATFVLVPGAWLGGWCWRKVTPLLRQTGHEVYPLTLTGLGERVHLGTPDTNLSTHVRDVINVLEYEDLRSVILVGHSYSGIVVTSVLHRVPERLAHVVYLEAAVPADGKSFFELTSPMFRTMVEEQARLKGDGWRWPMPEPAEMGMHMSLDGLSDADLRWMQDKGTSHPLGTLSEPVRLGNPAADRAPRTYVDCGEGRQMPPEYLEPFRTTPGWRYRELLTSHWPMISRPRETADLLLELA